MLFIDMQMLIKNLRKTLIKITAWSFLKHWDINDLYGWAMSQKLHLGNFKWVEATSEFNEHWKRSYNDESGERYYIEVDAQYPEYLHNLHYVLPFFPERMKFEKVEKLVAGLHDKEEYVIHIKNFKQTSIHGLVLERHIESLNLIKKLTFVYQYLSLSI